LFNRVSFFKTFFFFLFHCHYSNIGIHFFLVPRGFVVWGLIQVRFSVLGFVKTDFRFLQQK
jgi:hypothetical protein